MPGLMVALPGRQPAGQTFQKAANFQRQFLCDVSPETKIAEAVTDQAKCEKWLSVEQAINSHPMALNSGERSLYAIISVGQTKVLQMERHKTNSLKESLYAHPGKEAMGNSLKRSG
uniref:Uncharacterized protein n=1 Tax=Romanomermis culicivorax TaxID=13658 RepID=A0A915HM87_ROMCU